MKSLTVILSLLAIITTSYAQNVFPDSGSVGIGTTAPNEKLEVVGGIKSSGPNAGMSRLVMQSTAVGGQQYEWYNDYMGAGSGVLGLYNRTSGNNPIVFNAAGNVGMGTTNPFDRLTVQGTFGVFGSGLDGSTYQRFVIYSDTTYGLLFEAPRDPAGNRLDQTFSWRGGGAAMTIKGTGCIGIGTTNPNEKLTVTNNASNAITLGVRGAYPAVSATGTNYYKQAEIGEPIYNIPAGVVDSGYRIGLAVQGYSYTSDFAGTLGTQMSLWVRAGSNSAAPTGTITNSYGIFLENLDGGVNVVNKFGLYQSNPTAKNYFAGNVGIGTTSPTEKLSVNGKIRAKEVIVETTGWSDHVFADSYKLQSLSEVEQHIKAEKHLPGVPSAQEVAAKGVSVGDMQAILLAKIEELTLHQIQQEKRLDAQQVEIVNLKAENSELKARTK